MSELNEPKRLPRSVGATVGGLWSLSFWLCAWVLLVTGTVWLERLMLTSMP